MDIASGFTLAKQAYDLLKVIKDGRDQGLITQAVGELHEKITELQLLNAKLSGLYQSERQVAMELIQEKANIEMFAVTAEKYEIYTTEGGSTVYRSKKPAESKMPHHYLCAHCYQSLKISILQPNVTQTTSGGYFVHYCPQCKNDYKMHKTPPIKQINVRWP